MESILNGENSSRSIAKGILAGFSNVDEITKSEEEIKLQDSLRKGEIEIISVEDLKENYNGVYLTKEKLEKAQSDVDSLIEKGEKSFVTEEEVETIEVLQNQINNSKQVILKGEDEDGTSILARVWVFTEED